MTLVVSMPARKLARRWPHGLRAFLFFSLLLSSTTTGTASPTLLTNGHPLHVRLPPGELVDGFFDRFIVNGNSGYIVFVPPGARTLTVEFQTTPGTGVELLAQADRDVGTAPFFDGRADYLADPDGNSLARIVISTELGRPDLRLKPGIYFIGFRLRDLGIRHEGVLTATIGGAAIDPEVRVQESIFTDDLDGWTHNSTASPIPGTNVGAGTTSLSHFAEGGNPGAYARLKHVAFFGPDEWFLAPPKYLINLFALEGPRFQFDLRRVSGDSAHNFNVHVRVFNGDTGYSWIGLGPPSTTEGWETFAVTIRADLWNRFVGLGSFEEVFSAPSRIEVLARYVVQQGTTGLDNFRLLARGGAPPIAVLPTVTSFSGGADGWGRNFPAADTFPEGTEGDEDSDLVWVDVEGNPGGYLRIFGTAADGGDAFVSGREYLGNLSGLDDPRFEFDYLHQSTAGASRPVEIRLVGRDTAYTWTGVVPADIWAHQIAPLTADEWTLASGDDRFAEVLADAVRIEVSADLAAGIEGNCIDNFVLLTSDSPPLPATMTANPPLLEFPGVAGVAKGAGAGAQVLRISSGGGSLRWEASVSGALAERITLSETTGDTPSTVFVRVDSAGLPAGTFEGRVTITALGTNISASVAVIRLVLDEQPIPTPLINDLGVVSSATFTSPLSPGILAAIFGRNLGGPVGGLNAGFGDRTGDRLPTSLGGVKVLVYDLNGTFIGEAPLLYVGDKQINFQLLFSLFGHTSARIVVEFNGVRSEPTVVPIQAWAPGIFTTGANRAVAANADGTMNASDNPTAAEGLLTIYMTGQGVVAPDWPAGRAAPSFPLIRAPSDITVTIGGVEAVVQFFGLAPGTTGVAQLNVFPAAGTPSGDQLLVVRVGGVVSNAVVVTIQ